MNEQIDIVNLLNDKTALVRYVGRKKTNPYII